MKDACDTCDAHLSWVDTAYWCDYECTFCPECTEGYGYVCPNCSGELRRRRPQARPLPPPLNRSDS